MKYERTVSALRNLGHALVRLANHVDDEYIVDLRSVLLRDLPRGVLTIRFAAGTLEPAGECPSALRESVAYWASPFPDHLRHAGVGPSALVASSPVLSLSGDLVCEARANDDRGCVHSVFV